MIKNAYRFEEHLKDKFMGIWYDPKYKYFNYNKYNSVYQNLPDEDGDWNERRFISCLSDGRIIGYISYEIAREPDYAYGFQIAMFSESLAAKKEFAKDVIRVIDDIFCKFRMNKVKFSVVRGNPAERIYDKFINDFNGIVVGVFRNDVKLIDNRLYDVKHYELHRGHYIGASDRIRKKYHIPECTEGGADKYERIS